MRPAPIEARQRASDDSHTSAWSESGPCVTRASSSASRSDASIRESVGSSGGGADKDADGRIDACEQAYGDLDLNGLIDGADLGALLSVWGLPNPPYGDLSGDGNVDGADLGELLSRWGPVP